MSIVGVREILPRTFEHRFGDPPRAQRVFAATVTVPVATQSVLDQIGIKHGSAHPEYPYLRCVNGSLNEVDRHHVEVTYDYELPARGNSEFEPNPLARRDQWSFSTGGAMVPALSCFAGSSDLVVPLVNSAGDIFEGVTRPEAELRVTISGNRPVFNLGLAATLTNTINRAPYLGGGPFTWMCAGISGSPQSEVVDGQEIEYYSFVTELIYRESSHLLFIPNVGWNYLENASAEADANEAAPTNRPPAAGTAIVTARLPRTSSSGIKKERAFVRDPEDKETKLPSSNPVALNANGSMKGPGLAPDVLVRRVNRAVNFSQFFGTPVRAIF
jgi:hypothetical protein